MDKQQKVVRLVSPVNPVPQNVPAGVGRKGRAALPKAAEVCEVINPPAVPSTPTWRSIADAAPGEQSEADRAVHACLTYPVMQSMHSIASKVFT